jgi:hypothetical protein
MCNASWMRALRSEFRTATALEKHRQATNLQSEGFWLASGFPI